MFFYCIGKIEDFCMYNKVKLSCDSYICKATAIFIYLEWEHEMDKILTFIVNEHNQILLLKGNKNDPQFKKSFWYVVTGACEEYDLNREETVKREIK